MRARVRVSVRGASGALLLLPIIRSTCRKHDDLEMSKGGRRGGGGEGEEGEEGEEEEACLLALLIP